MIFFSNSQFLIQILSDFNAVSAEWYVTAANIRNPLHHSAVFIFTFLAIIEPILVSVEYKFHLTHLCWMDSSTITLQASPFSQYKGCLVSFIITIFIETPMFNVNSVDPDQTPLSAASDLDLHCLPMSLLWNARLKLVKPMLADVWSVSTELRLRFSCVYVSFVSNGKVHRFYLINRVHEFKSPWSGEVILKEPIILWKIYQNVRQKKIF